MTSSRREKDLSPRVRKAGYVESVEFPRWLLPAAALLIGLTVLMGALADAGGRLRNPGTGGFVYMAAVVIVAARVVYFDRKKRSTAKQLILGCLRWNLSCWKRSSPLASDIAGQDAAQSSFLQPGHAGLRLLRPTRAMRVAVTPTVELSVICNRGSARNDISPWRV